MDKLRDATLILARSCNGNPLMTTGVVILFYLMTNALMATLETLLYGERFEHWLDPVLQVSAIAYSAYAVWGCALHNSRAAHNKS